MNIRTLTLCVLFLVIGTSSTTVSAEWRTLSSGIVDPNTCDYRLVTETHGRRLAVNSLITAVTAPSTTQVAFRFLTPMAFDLQGENDDFISRILQLESEASSVESTITLISKDDSKESTTLSMTAEITYNDGAGTNQSEFFSDIAIRNLFVEERCISDIKTLAGALSKQKEDLHKTRRQINRKYNRLLRKMEQ